MKKIWGTSIASVLALSLLLATSTVHADIGPASPSMDFVFEYEAKPVSILSGQLIHCDDITCTQNRPAIPAQFYCDEQSCFSIGIIEGYAPYQKIVITFADAKRESNPFSKIAYFAKYLVTVKDDSLYVREIFPDSILEFFSPIQVLGFLPALVVTVIAETIAAALFSRGIKTSIKWVGYANALSLPIVWFVFPFLHLSAVLVFVLAETFAVIFEALFLHTTNKKTGLSFKQASSASLVMNLSSIVVGALTVALIIGFIYLLS